MSNLKTTYLGLTLNNPLVVSASPLSKKVDNIRQLEDAGAGAVVLYSLFEEQLRQESLHLDETLNQGTESFAEALSYFPPMESYNMGPEKYLKHLQKSKAAVDIPIIASLNGSTLSGWLNFAEQIQDAGADAIELNIYRVPTDLQLTGEALEESQLQLVRQIKQKLRIPLAVKLSPYYSAFAGFASRMADAGADGLVLFNRFYQPDLDIINLTVSPDLNFSRSEDLRLPLRWIAMLYGHIQADFALTSGVHTREDIVKAIMAGANVSMLASSILQNGIPHLAELLKGLKNWMQIYRYNSIDQMRGNLSQKSVSHPEAFERANYLKILNSLDYKLR
jgi:dihydroorotate dehydrogenase (fumarate)